MRPAVLNPLFVALDRLYGLGKRLAPLYARLVQGEMVVHALWHLPISVIDRRSGLSVAEAPHGAVVTLAVVVDSHQPPQTSRYPYRIRCRDHTGYITVTYFRARRAVLEQLYPVGQERIISGRVEVFYDERQMVHPDYVVPPHERDEIAIVEPIYPLTAGIAQKVAVKVARSALEQVPELPEWLDGPLKNQRQWPDWRAALYQQHNPADGSELSPFNPNRQRLAYDELLANQLALLLVRRATRHQSGRVIKGDGRMRQAVLDALPFSLTGAQSRALEDIYRDMEKPIRMLRLLQGDVGSGKTAVALQAMLNAVETGAQAALMVPTEILARQHMETLEPLAKVASARIALLTGRDKGKARAALLQALAEGEIDILVGTHALFQADVAFKDLAFAVIDEQHRFGVNQRLELSGKGRATDVLVMTATPIPRTLTLTHYGDMDSSVLDEKPPGRKPVDTRALPTSRLHDVISGVRRAIDNGNQVYWVCPLVEDMETSDLAAAEDRYAMLQETFGDRVGLVHGKMKGAAKDAVMEAFAGGELDLLVATTVIEVGVNVPSATVMVIEHAERFGLAQLHQLRGRIGRGDKASTCLLLYAPPLGETSKARLEIMRQSEDGFLIAEEDLRLRGGGEVLGTRQSGLPEFHLADLAAHGDLLAIARNDAAMIVETDPDLETPRGQALRVLLYLFERDAAVRTLRSG